MTFKNDPRHHGANDPRVGVQSRPCVRCGNKLDAATPAKGEHRRPQQGDITVCAYCATIYEVDALGRLEPVTFEQVAGKLDPPERQTLERTIRIIHSKRHLPS